MVEGLAPGDWVRNPLAPEWGLGQVQSVIGERVTANFENAGKRLINAAVVSLTRVEAACAAIGDVARVNPPPTGVAARRIRRSN